MARKSRVTLFFVLVLSLVLAVVAPVSAQGKVLRVGMATAAGTTVQFDISLATDTTSHTFINMLFPGLAPRDETTGLPQHGMAESWTVSEDTLTYTFTLKQGVPWVTYDAATDSVVEVTDESGAVRYVKAQDFVYSALRTMNPETAADYAYLAAGWVVGGNEYNSGEGAAEDVAIKALDDYTLQITSPEPAGFLLQVYGEWLFAAQPSWSIEANGDAWTLPGNYHSYGSFVLKAYEPGSRVELIKNPFWTGTESHPVPKLDAIEVRMLDGSAALAAFEAGELDTIDDVPLPDLPRLRVERPDELYIGPGSCTYYYGFNVLKEPVNNVHMRRALSLAIDRQTIVDAILQAGQQPAGFFTRPNYAAAATQEEYPDLGVRYDPDRAKQELELYFQETGNTLETMPPITLMYNTSESHAIIAQAVQQMWKEVLGIEVTVANQEWQTYLDTLDEDAPQVWRLGWCEDYQDPNNFLGDVFRSDSGNNNTNWGNEEFDALIDQAKVMLDFEARKPLYARAEHILTWEDCAMAPIYYYTELSMIGKHLEATYSILGTVRYDKWDIKG
ncbi:MAG: peptide ABC transporter substrate-binding protein [Anaerolineae bacterium]|nr:peptide ABC transporter substrate-binding protein [Anaerolineae bacterium]